MGKVSLGIYDKEGEYAKRLGRFIRRKSGEMMDVRIFTKLETLKKCLDSGGVMMALVSSDAQELCAGYKELRTFILSEEMVKKTRQPQNISNVNMLREKPGYEESGYGETGYKEPGYKEPVYNAPGHEATGTVVKCPFIDKYQSAEEIWRSLLMLAGDYIYGKDGRKPDTLAFEMYAVVSPVHRSGKTFLTFSLGKELAERRDGRVLIVSMDEFSFLPWTDEGDGGGDVSELFYYYSQGQLDSGKICAAVSRYGEAEYLRPARIPEDLYREGKPYPPEFFEQLAVQGGYHYLVMDIGNVLAFRGDLLRLCSRLFIPKPGSREGEARLAMFQEWLMRHEIEGKQIMCDLSGVEEPFDMELKAESLLKQCV